MAVSRNNPVLRRIKQIGREVGASPKEIKAAIETGIVESGMRNLPGGDADSAGWRQERASLYKNPTNLDASIRRFFKETSGVKNKYGSSGQLAAAVQRPAAQYRGRYQQVSGQAGSLLGGPGGMSPGARSSSLLLSKGGPTGPAVTSTGATRGDLLQEYLKLRGRPGSALMLAEGLGDLKTPSANPVSVRIPIGAVSGAPMSNGAFKITGANPGRLRPGILSFARKVSSIYGKPLTGDSGATHSKMTVDGNVSDHWAGNATDIPASGKQLIAMGQAALIAAGMPRAQARTKTGGLYNVGGHQIIFATMQGGDHTTHLHISAR